MRRRSSKDIINQILARSSGLRGKVDSNCVYCTYDDQVNGTWRQQIEACAVTECPLHSVRPRSYRKKTHKADSNISSKPICCEDGPKIGDIAT
jgi:hypothetical protein